MQTFDFNMPSREFKARWGYEPDISELIPVIKLFSKRYADEVHYHPKSRRPCIFHPECVVLLAITAMAKRRRTLREIETFGKENWEVLRAINLPGPPSFSTIRRALQAKTIGDLQRMLVEMAHMAGINGIKAAATDGKAFHMKRINNNPKNAGKKRNKQTNDSQGSESKANSKERKNGDIKKEAGSETKVNFTPKGAFMHCVVTADYKSRLIIWATPSDNRAGELTLLRRDINNIINSFHINEWLMDGAYDSGDLFDLLAEKNIKPIIPIHKTSTPRAKGSPARRAVVMNVEDIGKRAWEAQQVGGLKYIPSNHKLYRKEVMEVGLDRWKKLEGYGRRTEIERIFSRVTLVFTDHCQWKTRRGREREMLFRFLSYNLLVLSETRCPFFCSS